MGRTWLAVIATLVAVLGAGPAAAGAATPGGTLDPAFDDDGKVTQPGYQPAEVLAGATHVHTVGGSGGVLRITRRTSDGELDTTYWGDGTRDIAVPGLRRVIHASPGFVVAETGSSSASVVRLKPSGHLDASFAGDGIAEVRLPAGSVVRDADVELNTAIILADGPNSTIVLARLRVDGTPAAPYFGGDGIAEHTRPAHARAWSILNERVDATCNYCDGTPDVRPVVVSGTDDGRTAVSRFDPRGAVDTAFSGDGRVDLSVAPARAALALDSKRRYLVARRSGGQAFVTRVLQSGAVDPGFGTSGRASLGGWRTLADPVVQRDDAVVLGGTDLGSPSRFRLARLTPDGRPDPTFAEGGTITTAFPLTAAVASLALQPDGRLVAAGPHGTGLALARYRGAPTTIEVSVDSQAEEVGIAFNNPVSAVGPDNLLVRNTPAGPDLTGSLRCLDSAFRPTSCENGRVLRAYFKPEAGIVVGEHFHVVVNPGTAGAPVTDDHGELPLSRASGRNTTWVGLHSPFPVWKWSPGIRSGALGGAIRIERTNGAQARFTFGQAATVYTVRGPSYGRYKLVVRDAQGKHVSTEEKDGYAPTTQYGVPNHVTAPTPGPNTVTVEVSGYGNPAASDHRVGIDGFRDGDGPIQPETVGHYRWGHEARKASDLAGSSVELRFQGQTIAMHLTRSSRGGHATVLIDGEYARTIDTYSPHPDCEWPVPWGYPCIRTDRFSGLGDGTHTIEVRVRGTSAAGSDGTLVDLWTAEAESGYRPIFHVDPNPD